MAEGKNKETVVALGYFDGIHKGHRAVLTKALSLAEEMKLKAVVLLFDEHPRRVLRTAAAPMLTDDEMKRELLEEMGIEAVDFNFRETMNYSPGQFAQKILVEGLNAGAVVCGYDYRYGKNASGNSETLKRDLESLGVRVISIEGVRQGDEIISASKIRELISQGEVLRANEMLGRPFTYNRVVERGDAIGRRLGFPTINQSFPEDFIVPKYGVYASVVRFENKVYPGVTNIGTRPTVNGSAVRSETCILGFSGDLYGKRVRVSLLKFLRPEMKFQSLAELSEAIGRDMEKAKTVYNEVMKNG